MSYCQNSITISIFEKADEKFKTLKDSHRWGQVLWNTAEDYITENCQSETIEKFMNLRNTDNDCYYSNSKVENFIKALDEIFNEEN